MNKCACRRRVGFTLIELLVVIAIIAILLMLLMPALERTRFKARCLTCMSNLHQWSIAFTTYAADHQGHFPHWNFVGGADGRVWDVGAGFWPTGMVSYGISEKLYFCPLERIPRIPVPNAGNYDLQGGTGYYNYALWIGRRTLWGNQMPQFYTYPNGVQKWTSPPLTIFTEPSSEMPIMTDFLIKPSNEFEGYHIFKGKVENANALFIDGRVVIRNPAQWKVRVNNGWGLNYYF